MAIRVEVARRKVVKAAVAYAKAFAKADALFHNTGDDPPDWSVQMSSRHNLMENAIKRLLKATNNYVKLSKPQSTTHAK